MWEDKHYVTEVYRLGLERFFRILTQDNLLQNFARGFKGPRDDTGLLDAGPPKEWTDAYLKLQKKAKKETNWVQVPDTSFQLAKDENGMVTLRGPGAFGGYSFSPEQWTAFLRTAVSLPAGADPLTTAGFGGVSSAPVDDRPQVKKRMEDNLRTLEQFANASSKAYPKNR